jgi:ribosomal protein S18 acetylase RimI-like enzyme
VDRQYHGRGLGAVLLADAIRRAVRSEPAVFALVVDAKDEAAAAFYRHHGFHPFASRPSSLFLPIATARKSIE